MSNLIYPTQSLTEDIEIPALGFGTWGLDKGKEQESIEYALELGYKHIDTADFYGTHEYIGKALENSGQDRESIFLATKLWKDSLDKKKVKPATERFLSELRTNYIDLLLIHRRNLDVDLAETLLAMQELVDAGLVRSLGVSNFRKKDIEDVLKTGIKVVNNQIEQHPSLNEYNLRDFCEQNGITITAYSPLARGHDLKIDMIKQLAEKYKRDPSQVVINWILAKGMVAIPKSSKKEHIKSNFESLEWGLSDEEVAQIDTLGMNYRVEEM